jgi:hypothetical protein
MGEKNKMEKVYCSNCKYFIYDDSRGGTHCFAPSNLFIEEDFSRNDNLQIKHVASIKNKNNDCVDFCKSYFFNKIIRGLIRDY